MDRLAELALAPDFAAINLAYLLLVIGAFCRSLYRLQILLVLAALAFVIYGAIQGIHSMIIWNLAIGCLNFRRLIVGVMGDARVCLTAQQETLRSRFFPDVNPVDFLSFWELGEDMWCVDDPVVGEGSAQDRLYLVIRGTVHVRRGGVVLAVLGSGSVIGHVASPPFLTSAADWQAVGAVWLRSWPLAGLAEPSLTRDALLARSALLSSSGDRVSPVGVGV